MKIVIISRQGSRGQAEKLTYALMKYTNHEVRCFLDFQFFRRGIKASEFDPPFFHCTGNSRYLHEMIKWADVIHFIHECSPRNLSRQFNCPEIIGKKNIVYERITMVDFRKDWAEKLWMESDYKRIKLCLVGAGWNRYSMWSNRKYTMMPTLVMIEDPLLKPVPFEDRKRIVTYAAMNTRSGQHPIYKGFPQTKQILKGLASDIFSRLHFSECCFRRKHAWVGVDEVITPILHFTPYEFASMGIPCISHYDSLTADTLRRITGSKDIPFIDATVHTLRNTVKSILEWTDDDMRFRSESVRRWMETYCHPRDVINRYLEIYRK